MKCYKCGNILNEDAIFCDNCGTKAEYIPEKQKSNSVTVILSVCLVALVIALVAIVFIVLKSSNTNPAPAADNAENVIPSPVPVQTQVPPPAQLVNPNAPVPPPASAPQEETITSVLYVVNCNEYITLRSQPSTTASEIAKIPLGSSVGYMSNSTNGFYKVSYNGKSGYALAAYLSASKPAFQNSITYMTVVKCNEWISLRDNPSTTANKITNIPLGATVIFLGGAANGFYKIQYNGYVGYALAAYLQP